MRQSEGSDLSGNSGSWCVPFPKELFSGSAIKKAAYKFTAHSFIYVTDSGGSWVAQLRAKQPGDWDRLLGEFNNEVLDQQLREDIARETDGIRDLILAQAFSRVSVFHPESDRPNELTSASSTAPSE